MAERSSPGWAAFLRAGCLCAVAFVSSSSARAEPEGITPEDVTKVKAREEVAAQLRRERQERDKAEAKKKALERQKEVELTRAKAKAIAKAKAAAKRQARARGKDDPTNKEQETAAVTALPLIIPYDPATIGIGGSCPGDNEISRGECALAAPDFATAHEHFRDAWNTQRSPFAAMRLGDLSWLEGETALALQWYEQVNGSPMMQRMANLRRCELEVGCGVTGRNVPSVETFNGPFGDEALLRTARIFARSGFPELAATLLVQANGRGCNIAWATCQQIAALALQKSTTTETLAFSLSMRRPEDAHDEARAIAARHLGFPFLAEDLEQTARGEIPEHRVTPQEEAAAAARAARAARKAAAQKEAAQKAAEQKVDGKGADGKVADGKVTDGKVTDGKVTDGKVTDGKVTDGKVTDGKVTDGKVTDGKVTDGKVTDGKVADGKGADGKGADGKGADGKGADGKGADGKGAPVPLEQEDPKAAAAKKAFAQKTRRDRIDDGVKRADESLEKTRRLLELASGALPSGGPK